MLKGQFLFLLVNLALCISISITGIQTSTIINDVESTCKMSEENLSGLNISTICNRKFSSYTMLLGALEQASNMTFRQECPNLQKDNLLQTWQSYQGKRIQADLVAKDYASAVETLDLETIMAINMRTEYDLFFVQNMSQGAQDQLDSVTQNLVIPQYTVDWFNVNNTYITGIDELTSVYGQVETAKFIQDQQIFNTAKNNLMNEFNYANTAIIEYVNEVQVRIAGFQYYVTEMQSIQSVLSSLSLGSLPSAPTAPSPSLYPSTQLPTASLENISYPEKEEFLVNPATFSNPAKKAVQQWQSEVDSNYETTLHMSQNMNLDYNPSSDYAPPNPLGNTGLDSLQRRTSLDVYLQSLNCSSHSTCASLDQFILYKSTCLQTEMDKLAISLLECKSLDILAAQSGSAYVSLLEAQDNALGSSIDSYSQYMSQFVTDAPSSSQARLNNLVQNLSIPNPAESNIVPNALDQLSECLSFSASNTCHLPMDSQYTKYKSSVEMFNSYRNETQIEFSSMMDAFSLYQSSVESTLVSYQNYYMAVDQVKQQFDSLPSFTKPSGFTFPSPPSFCGQNFECGVSAPNSSMFSQAESNLMNLPAPGIIDVPFVFASAMDIISPARQSINSIYSDINQTFSTLQLNFNPSPYYNPLPTNFDISKRNATKQSFLDNMELVRAQNGSIVGNFSVLCNSDGVITFSPTMSSPTMSSPTMSSPTMSSPTMSSPTISSPTMSSPSMSSPTMSSPTMSSPTMSSPTMSSPTISSPTISSPTMSSPTMSSPTMSSPPTTSPTSKNIFPNTTISPTQIILTSSTTLATPSFCFTFFFLLAFHYPIVFFLDF